MIKKMYQELTDAGLRVFSPARFTNQDSSSPYVVVVEQEQTGYGNNKVGFQIVSVVVHVPLDDYFRLEEECEKVRIALLGKFNATGYESKPIVEDDLGCFTKSIQYIIKKKLRR